MNRKRVLWLSVSNNGQLQLATSSLARTLSCPGLVDDRVVATAGMLSPADRHEPTSTVAPLDPASYKSSAARCSIRGQPLLHSSMSTTVLPPDVPAATRPVATEGPQPRHTIATFTRESDARVAARAVHVDLAQVAAPLSQPAAHGPTFVQFAITPGMGSSWLLGPGVYTFLSFDGTWCTSWVVPHDPLVLMRPWYLPCGVYTGVPLITATPLCWIPAGSTLMTSPYILAPMPTPPTTTAPPAPTATASTTEAPPAPTAPPPAPTAPALAPAAPSDAPPTAERDQSSLVCALVAPPAARRERHPVSGAGWQREWRRREVHRETPSRGSAPHRVHFSRHVVVWQPSPQSSPAMARVIAPDIVVLPPDSCDAPCVGLAVDTPAVLATGGSPSVRPPAMPPSPRQGKGVELRGRAAGRRVANRRVTRDPSPHARPLRSQRAEQRTRLVRRLRSAHFAQAAEQYLTTLARWQDDEVEEPPHRISLMLDAVRMMVNVTVDGHDARALIDTGATVNAVSPRWLDRLPTAADGLRSRCVDGGVEIQMATGRRARAQSTLPDGRLELGGRTVTAPFQVVALPDGVDIIVGTPALGQLQAHISFDGTPLARLAVPSDAGGVVYPPFVQSGVEARVDDQAGACPDVQFADTAPDGSFIVGAVRSQCTTHLAGSWAWNRADGGAEGEIEMVSSRAFWAGRTSTEGVYRVTVEELLAESAADGSSDEREDDEPAVWLDPDDPRIEVMDESVPVRPRVSAMRPGVDIDTTAPECEQLKADLLADPAFSRVWEEPRGEPRGVRANTEPMRIVRDVTKPPPKSRRYPVPRRMRDVLRRWLEDMMSRGLVEPTRTARHTSPIFCVPKPRSPGQWRVVMDMRAVNASLAEVSSFTLPEPSELLHDCAHAKFVSAIDLRDGYYCLGLHPDDRDETAFIVDHRTYRLTVAPMGCSQTPAAFQAMVSRALREYDLLGDHTTAGEPRPLRDGSPFVLDGQRVPAGAIYAYLDDILIVTNSDDPMEHDALLRRVFMMLEQEDLHLKPAKCNLFCRHARFLGHVVGDGTLRPDPNKCAAISRWNAATDFGSLTDVRSFLGLSNFYRCYVPDFASLVHPLTRLTVKGAPFVWSPECIAAVTAVQAALTSDTVLQQPDFNRPFTISVDASDFAVGAVLHQEDPLTGQQRPVEYYSATFDATARNYAARDKEALALVCAVRHWRYYLFGSRFRVRLYSDHQSLQFLTTQATLSGRLWRWYEELSDFNFEIVYVRGHSNTVADALSRLPSTTEEEQAALAFDGPVAASMRSAPPAAGPTPASPVAATDAPTTTPTAVPTARTAIASSTEAPTAAARMTYLGVRTDVVTLMRGQPVADAGQSAITRAHMFWDTEYAVAVGAAEVLAPVRTRAATAAADGAENEPTDLTAAAPRYRVRFDGTTSLRHEEDTVQGLLPATMPYDEDPFTAALITVLSDSEAPLTSTELRRAHRVREQFEWAHERLWYVEGTGHRRLVVPATTASDGEPSLRARIVQAYHVPATAGHRGADITLARVQRSWYWPGMATQVKAMVAGCGCQRSKASTQRPMGLLQPLEPPDRPFTHITMDLITDLPPHPIHGYDAILVVVDRFSKMVRLLPTDKSLTAAGTMQLLEQHVFCTMFGWPVHLVTDRDPRWTAATFRAFCSEHNIHHALSTANHPQTDGQTERTNRVVEEIARSYLGFDQSALWELLPEFEFAINDSPLHQVGGLSPFEIVMGQSPLRPIDVAAGVASAPALPPDGTERTAAHAARRREVRERLRAASAAMAVQANRRRRPVPPELRAGAQVYVKREYLLTPAQRAQLKTDGRRKLQPKYNGPYKVLERVGNLAVRIELPAGSRAHPVIHVEALKLYQPHGIEGVAPPQVLELVEGTGAQQRRVYEVEKLLQARRNKGGTTSYLAQWRYYPLGDASWVRYADLGQYWQQHIPHSLLQPTAKDRADAQRTPLEARDGTSVMTAAP